MADTKYEYDITATANDAVNNTALRDEIREAQNVPVACDRVDTAGSTIEVWMRDPMPDDVAGASAILAAHVAAHQGAPDDPEIVTVEPTFEMTFGIHPRWEGHLYTAVAGATNFFDELITTEKQLRGGWYRIFDDNAQIGDYIEESVIDKDDVLGLFAAYGLTVGVDVLELKKYVKTNYISPGDKSRQVFMARSTFVIMAGLYTRTTYHSTGSQDVNLEVVTLAYE